MPLFRDFFGGPPNPRTPTSQMFLSGSGVYALPANVAWIVVTAVGGGGGGGGSHVSGTPAGTGAPGGATIFGSLITAGGGNGGSSGPNVQAAAGGTPTVVFPATTLAPLVRGGSGQPGGSLTSAAGNYGFQGGGNGGQSPFGGEGRSFSGSFPTPSAGEAAISNSGSGGAGGACSSGTASQNSDGGCGGGAGAVVRSRISDLSPSYTYTVGSGGAGGTAGGGGAAGGAGGSGFILVEEFYS